MNEIYALSFGLLLGIKHAFEADHLIAVSTMLAEHKNTKKAAFIGMFWGIGHTTTLLIVGLFVLFLSLSIPEYIASRLEGIVGMMLIMLGIQSITNSSHGHNHLTIPNLENTNQTAKRLHKKSFLIGMVHGLAGSGGLMILVLSLIHSVWEGVLYILLFGIGSIISMSAMSLLIGIPLSKSMRVFKKTERYIRIIAGVISILFGIFIIISLL